MDSTSPTNDQVIDDDDIDNNYSEQVQEEPSLMMDNSALEEEAIMEDEEDNNNENEDLHRPLPSSIEEEDNEEETEPILIQGGESNDENEQNLIEDDEEGGMDNQVEDEQVDDTELSFRNNNTNEVQEHEINENDESRVEIDDHSDVEDTSFNNGFGGGGMNDGQVEEDCQNESNDPEEEQQRDDEDSALDLKWIFGMNKDILGGMHNLCDDYRKEVFYVAGNVGIIFRYESKEQVLLQGHTNTITCCAVSRDKKWIVTADSGKENMIVIWDSYKGIPVKTIFDPHPLGISSVDISCDSMLIYSLSKQNEDGEQQVSVWEWTEELEGAKVSSLVPNNDFQSSLTCHYANPAIFLTNGPKSVVFWEHNEDTNTLEYFCPSTAKSDFRQASSEFIQTTYVENTTMAASGTSDGEIVLWERKIFPDREAKEIEKEAMKVVKIHTGYSVNYITCAGPFIVSGGSDGFVKFLDHKLRLEAWFEDFNLGPVVSISFDKATKEQSSAVGGQHSTNDDDIDDDGSIKRDFYSPDFMIQTKSGFIAKAKSSSFHDYDVDGMKGRILVTSQNESIQTLAVHPTKPYIAISGLSGYVHIWDYQLKEVIKVLVLKGMCISSLAFDNRGEYLSVGCTSGYVKFFDAVLFTEIVHFGYRPSKACIQSLKFSHDSLFLAFYDTDFCVGIFKFMPNPQKKGLGKDEWMYLGRYRSHKRAITGLEFGIEPYGDIPRLLSVSEDRRLIEYDLENSSIQGGVKVKTIHRITQDAIPTAFLWYRDENVIEMYPNEKKYFDGLLFSNDQYKITSFITPYGHKDTRCNRTILSPTYGGPLNNLMIVPNYVKESTSLLPELQPPKYLCYSTNEKVIGMIALPLDGNPKHHMGLVAHAGEITASVVSPDGKYLFTAGGSDCMVNQWKIIGTPLDRNMQIDEGISPYVGLIEGGEEGEFFQEVQQYFYYAQIRSQGEITTSERKITGSVPINQMPDLVRSLGFYATQWEIQNMIYELRVIKGVGDPSENGSSNLEKRSKKEPEIFIDFNVFVKIYVNHRPVFGIQRKDIEEAFVKLGSEPITGFVNKTELFQKLKTMGEKISENELNDCLCKLLKDTVTVASLEERFTSVEFAEKLLGFSDEPVEDV